MFGDPGSTLGPPAALPFPDRVGLPAGWLACAGLVAAAAVAARTLTADPVEASGVPADG